MKQAAEEVERRLHLMSGMMFAGHGLGMWCYSMEKKLFFSTSPYWEELQMFLKVSGILDELTASEAENPLPMVYSDELGLIWIGERVNLRNGGTLFVLCGPAFIRKNNRNEVLRKLEEMNLSLSLRMKYSRILSDISVLETEALRTVFLQLHFDIYDEYLPEDLLRITSGKEEKAADEEPHAPEKLPGENKALANEPDAIVYGKMKRNETELLNCVRAGFYEEPDPGKASLADRNHNDSSPDRNDSDSAHFYGAFVDFGLSDELRSLQDNMILFLDKCSEAAIEGGLSLETSKAIERAYVKKLEECRTIADAANTNWEGFRSFVAAVHKAKNRTRGGISLPVQTTMDYIRRNYDKPLTLKELAAKAGYDEYYLSRKFSKETGTKVQDYIRDVRMNMAKVMLLSTQLGIDEIAERLQYKSRSHFDRVFVNVVGVTPAQYRAGKTKG